MGELTAGALIETALQIQMARATDGKAPDLSACVCEASSAWWKAFQLASADDEKDEGPGLFGARLAEDGQGVAPCGGDSASREMVREEAALRQIMRTWAAETLVTAEGAVLKVQGVVLNFRFMLSDCCVQAAPGLDVDEMVVQEICGAFPEAQLIEAPDGQYFRNLRKAVPA